MFHKKSIPSSVVLLFVFGTQLWAGEISPDLMDKLRSVSSNQHHSCLVVLKDRIDGEYLNWKLAGKKTEQTSRHGAILDLMQDKARQTQARLTSYLGERKQVGSVREFRTFWISNAIKLVATREEIEKIALMPEVEEIYDDIQIELIEPVDCESHSSSDSSNNDNFDAIGIRKMWYIGFTGKGRLVCNLDCGVDVNHPAVAAKWRGNNGGTTTSSWFDPHGSALPNDLRGHGTHTMGIMIGSSAGDTLGVAFNAEWIAAGVVDRGWGVSQTISDILSAFQWAVDPDSNNQTTEDVPDVISNSWGVPSGILPSCDQVFWEAIDNVEQLGIVTVFSAGNEGPNSLTIRNPADRASSPYNSLAVGAIDAHLDGFPIASFSSRGPSACDGKSIKPELSAPGVEIRSSYKDGQYKILSGTSMAAPFVAGTVALLREYNPNATVDEIKQALVASATDLGPLGEDNDYGYGLINVRRALEYLPAPTTPCVYLDTLMVENQLMDSIVSGDTIRIVVNLKNAGADLGVFNLQLESADVSAILLQNESFFDSLKQGKFITNIDHPFVVYLVPSQEEKLINFKINITAEDQTYGRQIDFNLLIRPGSALGVGQNSVPLTRFNLGQNYPNPFNPSTTIPFDLEKESHVSLKIYNIKGEAVRTLLEKDLSKGRYQITWKGENQSGMKVASGVYFYSLQKDGFAVSRKMILVK